jgi:hypothetical protein
VPTVMDAVGTNKSSVQHTMHNPMAMLNAATNMPLFHEGTLSTSCGELVMPFSLIVGL